MTSRTSVVLGAPPVGRTIEEARSFHCSSLKSLLNETVPMANEFPQITKILRGKPNTRKVSGAREVGEEFRIRPIGLIGSLFHPGDITGMGETDRPLVFRDKFFGKVCRAGAGFDGGVDVVAEGSDEAKDGFGIIGNGLIDENLPLWIHDADLNGGGVVVNTDVKG